MQLKIEWRSDGKLWVSKDNTDTPVQARCCFPWSKSKSYISLRDKEDNEVALVEELTDLDGTSREALELALIEAGFVMEITGVISLKEDFEIRSWQVETRQGKRHFQTKLDDWPQSLPGGGLLIRDVAGDLFHIEDPHSLDESSRKLIWAFVS